MKVACDRVIVCGNYKCGYNDNGHCTKVVVALDSNGQCALMRPKREYREEKEIVEKRQEF